MRRPVRGPSKMLTGSGSATTGSVPATEPMTTRSERWVTEPDVSSRASIVTRCPCTAPRPPGPVCTAIARFASAMNASRRSASSSVTTPVTRTRLPDRTRPASTFARSALISSPPGAAPGAEREQAPAALPQNNATTTSARWRPCAATPRADDRPVHQPVISPGFTPRAPLLEASRRPFDASAAAGKTEQSRAEPPRR